MESQATCLLTLHFMALEERRRAAVEIHRRFKPGATTAGFGMPSLCRSGARSITLGRTPLVPVQAKSLRSHALDLVIEGVHLLRAPRIPGFRRIGAAQFFQRFLDGEFWGFGHGKPHIQAKRSP